LVSFRGFFRRLGVFLLWWNYIWVSISLLLLPYYTFLMSMARPLCFQGFRGTKTLNPKPLNPMFLNTLSSSVNECWVVIRNRNRDPGSHRGRFLGFIAMCLKTSTTRFQHITTVLKNPKPAIPLASSLLLGFEGLIKEPLVLSPPPKPSLNQWFSWNNRQFPEKVIWPVLRFLRTIVCERKIQWTARKTHNSQRTLNPKP